MTHTPLLNTPRISRTDYFLGIAKASSRLGDCCRVEVGAILVDNTTERVLATGRNGSEPGGPSCRAGECPRCLSDAPPGAGYESCVERHAEWNVIDQAMKYLPINAFENTTMYVTREPCWMCRGDMQNLGIPRAIYLADHLYELKCCNYLDDIHWETVEL